MQLGGAIIGFRQRLRIREGLHDLVRRHGPVNGRRLRRGDSSSSRLALTWHPLAQESGWIEKQSPLLFFLADAQFNIVFAQLFVIAFEVVTDESHEGTAQYHGQTNENLEFQRS
jgi:hypothetical protein